MEDVLLEFGLKDGLFAGLFIWLLYHQMKTAHSREEKLYGFLDSMKEEFKKLVHSYENLSKDVKSIRIELNKKVDKHIDDHIDEKVDRKLTEYSEYTKKGND